MLTTDEQRFIDYWEQNRLSKNKGFWEFVKGFYRGLAVCFGVIAAIAIGWNERANMVANSKMNMLVFTVALLLIALFMAWLYSKFSWEMKEQQFLELKAKQNKQHAPNVESE